MAEEKRRSEEDDEIGPGVAYQPFIIMEEILDKLKLLNYESSFCKELSCKPFNRHYFAIATNPGEQFHYFASLAAWFIRQTGRSFDPPQEYDDPNAVISRILSYVREFGCQVDFAPNKLKQGCGEYVIFVLNKLSIEVLKARNFAWKIPEYPTEEHEEDEIIDDDAELDMNKVDTAEYEVADYEDDEEGALDLNDLDKLNKGHVSGGNKPDQILESSTDAVEWKLEVERVLPRLKVTIRTDNKDWRNHMDQIHQYKDSIKKSLDDTRSQLDSLCDETTKAIDKITSREKYLNSQLECQLQDFRLAQDSFAEKKEQYKQTSSGVTDRSRSLADITDEIEHVKQEMEVRGSSMTDGTPLHKLKKSISQVRKEITSMRVREGTLQHCLLQLQFQSRNTAFSELEEPIY